MQKKKHRNVETFTFFLIRKAAEAAAICLAGEAVHCAADVANHLEIDTAVSILVEDPEDLVDEDLGVAGGENHGVHLQDLVLAQLAVRAVLLEASAIQQQQLCWLNFICKLPDHQMSYLNSLNW